MRYVKSPTRSCALPAIAPNRAHCWPSRCRSAPELDQLQAPLSALMTYRACATDVPVDTSCPIDAARSPETLRHHTLRIGERLGTATSDHRQLPAAATDCQRDSSFIRSREEGCNGTLGGEHDPTTHTRARARAYAVVSHRAAYAYQEASSLVPAVGPGRCAAIRLARDAPRPLDRSPGPPGPAQTAWGAISLHYRSAPLQGWIAEIGVAPAVPGWEPVPFVVALEPAGACPPAERPRPIHARGEPELPKTGRENCSVSRVASRRSDSG